MKKFIVLIAATALLLTQVILVHAQSGGPYAMTWSSTNSSGSSSGGAYTLNATLSSQGTSTSSGGSYTLGSVWSGTPEKWPWAYLPLVQR